MAIDVTIYQDDLMGIVKPDRPRMCGTHPPEYSPEYIAEWLKNHRHPKPARPVGSVQPIALASPAQMREKAAFDATETNHAAVAPFIEQDRARAEHLMKGWEFTRIIVPMAYYSHVKRVSIFALPEEHVHGDLFRGKADFSSTPTQVTSMARCECGASKTGIADYAMGHSSWCPVKE